MMQSSVCDCHWAHIKLIIFAKQNQCELFVLLLTASHLELGMHNIISCCYFPLVNNVILRLND